MMPMLSLSHCTTAPAMATEPWEEVRDAQSTYSDSDILWRPGTHIVLIFYISSHKSLINYASINSTFNV